MIQQACEQRQPPWLSRNVRGVERWGRRVAPDDFRQGERPPQALAIFH